MKVAKNKVVTIDYTLTDDDGTILDTSAGEDPLAYLHGVGGLIPGLEQELEGRSPGESFKASIPPEQAYGVRNEELVQPVPKRKFAGVKDLAVGMELQANTEIGPQVVRVVGITPEDVMIDANHALAGKTLHFEVEVLDVRDASEEELEHGHAHGESCCGGDEYDEEDED